jgi:hypothetical protein
MQCFAMRQARKFDKQQIVASPLPDEEDNESVRLPPPQPDYFPGWTPEATFDWAPNITGGEDGTKGKEKAAGEAEASCDTGSDDPNGTRRDGDEAAGGDADADADAIWTLGSSVGDLFSSTWNAYSSADNSAPGGSGTSSSQQSQPCDAPAVTTLMKQQLGCTWASTGTVMWREIGSGFHSLPDFTSPRMQTGRAISGGNKLAE